MLSLESVPAHLRGYVGRYLQEAAPLVFVGNLSSRVSDALWARVTATTGSGRAVFVTSGGGSEQGYTIRMHNVTGCEIRDFDGWHATVKRVKPQVR